MKVFIYILIQWLTTVLDVWQHLIRICASVCSMLL